MGIMTDAQLARLPLAQAIVHVRRLFEEAPHLIDSDNHVPGCGGVTWRDLHTLVGYAAEQFDKFG